MPNESTEALIEAVGAPAAARVHADMAALEHILPLETIRREYLEPILR